MYRGFGIHYTHHGKVVFDKIKVSKKFEFIAVGSCNIPCNSLAVPQTLSILGFLTPVSIQIRE